MRKGLPGLLVLVALAPVSGATGAVGPVVAPRSGVVLTSQGGRIIAVNVNGSGVRNLTPGVPSVDALYPAVSPDGTSIAFSRSSGVYVVNSDGTGLRRVGPGGRPEWSADGGWLAASSSRGGVYVVKADGTNMRRIGKGTGPAWSPDGQWLAYEHNLAVYVVRLDGTKTMRLPTATDYAWSPESRLLGYASRWSSSAGLRVVDVKSGESRKIVANRTLGRGVRFFGLSWSPDGSRIALPTFSDADDTEHVYVVTLDGSPPRRIKPLSDDGAPLPTWSPDGTRIAYTSNPDFTASDDRVVVVDAASGAILWKLRPIAGQASRSPSWSPDGKELVFEGGNVVGAGDPGHGDSFDFWAVSADGTGASQLTAAFPFAGVDDQPTWWRGRTSVAPDPPLPTVALKTLATQRAKSPYDIVGADGQRLAVTLQYRAGTGGIRASYDGGRRTWRRIGNDLSYADSAAFDGRRMYWSSNDREDSELYTIARPGSRSKIIRGSGGDNAGQHFTVGSDRSLVALTVGRGLWRVRGTRAQRIRYERTPVDLVDVDGGRILLIRGDRLELVSNKGRLLRSFSSRGGPIQDGRLSGRRVVAVGHSRILVFDARTGRLRATWHVGAPGLPPSAGFIYKSLLPYADGSALHVLDVDTGHDLIMQIRGVTEPVDGAVTNQGLLYSRTATYSRMDGRLGLVPLKTLRAALRAVPTA